MNVKTSDICIRTSAFLYMFITCEADFIDLIKLRDEENFLWAQYSVGIFVKGSESIWSESPWSLSD